MATGIQIRSSSDEVASDTQTDCCGICERQFAKYTCPRCNVRYCSLDCYKSEKHAHCSELFYKNCFMEALKEKSVSSKEKHQMLEMLKRLESSHADDPIDPVSDEDGMSLEERLGALNLDVAEPDVIWDCLTDSERREFQQLLQNGEMANSISLQKPWWEHEGSTRALVEVVGDKDEQVTSNIPAIMDNIPPLSSLLKATAPAVQLKYNTISVLLHNGDHMDMVIEAAQAVLDLCPVLAQNVAYADVSEAVHHCLQTCQQHKHSFGSLEHSLSVLHDVVKILTLVAPKTDGSSSHNNFILAALSDLYRLLEAAIKEFKKTVTQEKRSERGVTSDMELKRLLQLAARKVYFFLSYVASNTHDLAALVIPVQLELDSIKSEIQEHQMVQSKVEKQREERRAAKSGVKQLIEEVT